VNIWIGSLAMILASAIVLMLETVFFHVLVYINNYLEATSIISVALLGIALGGVIGYYLADRPTNTVLSCVASASGVATVLCILNFVYTPQFLTYPVLLVSPFLGVSVVVAVLFSRLPKHAAYFWNLTGAALGVALVCILVPRVRSENVILLGIALCGVLGFLLALSSGRCWRGYVASAVVMLAGGGALVWNIRTDAFDFGKVTRCTHRAWPLKFHTGSPKTFCRIRQGGYDLAYVRDNLVSRVDILGRTGGKGFTFSVFQEGVVSDIVQRRAPRTYQWDCRIPAALAPDPTILVIGTSAEGVTKTAKFRSKQKVVGIEINPAIVDLMQHELYEPSWKAYDDIELHVTDARTYLEGTDRTFDLITLMNAHTRGRVSENVGLPQYLFTEEAFALMFERLTDRGALLIEEVLAGDQTEDFVKKIFASAIAGLRRHGMTGHFERHFYSYTFRGRFLMFIIKKEPFSQADLARLDEWFESRRQADPHLAKIVSYIHPDKELDNAFSRFVRDPEGETRTAREKGLDLSPICDDRPFLYDVNMKHPEAERTFLLSVVATLLLILLPCGYLFTRAVYGEAGQSALYIIYFSVIGVAYMLVEIVLMQKYQLYLGSPIYSFIVVLTSILFFSGLGSLTSSVFSEGLKKYCILAAPLLLVAFSVGLDRLFTETQSLPFAYRVAVALASLFPLFFCMGVPFPFGLSAASRRFPGACVSLLYGINGAFGTIGATLSLFISVNAGFVLTFRLGIALYFLAFLIALYIARSARQPVTALDSPPEEACAQTSPAQESTEGSHSQGQYEAPCESQREP
jgi:spermidine synthase